MSSKLLLILFALLLNCTFVLAQNKDDDAIKYFLKRGEDFLQKKEYNQAITAFNDAVQVCPSCLMPYFKKAITYAEMGDFFNADKELKIAYKTNPNSTNNIWFGALVKSKKGLFTEALKDAQNQIAKQTTDAGKQNWNRLKNIILARELNFKENQIAGIIYKAQESFNSHEYEIAISQLDSAIAICPSCAEPHFKKAITFAEQKNFEKADEEIRAGSVLSIGVTQAIRYTAMLKAKKGKLDDALQDIQNQINIDTSTRSICNWYGLKAELEMKDKRYVEAYNDNCKVYSISPKSKHTLYLMMLHEIHTKQNDKLAAHFKEFTIDNSTMDSSRYYYDKGYLYYELKDYRTALQYFEENLKLLPKNANGLIMRAMVKVLINPNNDGLTDANLAVQLHPKSAGILNNRGFVKIIMGDYTTSIADLEKAMELNKTIPEPYNNLGYIYYKLGGQENYEKAKFNYYKALEIGGKDYKPYWKYIGQEMNL